MRLFRSTLFPKGSRSIQHRSQNAAVPIHIAPSIAEGLTHMAPGNTAVQINIAFKMLPFKPTLHSTLQQNTSMLHPIMQQLKSTLHPTMPQLTVNANFNIAAAVQFNVAPNNAAIWLSIAPHNAATAANVARIWFDKKATSCNINAAGRWCTVLIHNVTVA